MKKCVADVLRVDFVVSAGVGGSLVERHLEDLRQVRDACMGEDSPKERLRLRLRELGLPLNGRRSDDISLRKLSQAMDINLQHENGNRKKGEELVEALVIALLSEVPVLANFHASYVEASLKDLRQIRDGLSGQAEQRGELRERLSKLAIKDKDKRDHVVTLTDLSKSLELPVGNRGGGLSKTEHVEQILTALLAEVPATVSVDDAKVDDAKTALVDASLRELLALRDGLAGQASQRQELESRLDQFNVRNRSSDVVTLIDLCRSLGMATKQQGRYMSGGVLKRQIVEFLLRGSLDAAKKASVDATLQELRRARDGVKEQVAQRGKLEGCLKNVKFQHQGPDVVVLQDLCRALELPVGKSDGGILKRAELVEQIVSTLMAEGVVPCSHVDKSFFGLAMELCRLVDGSQWDVDAAVRQVCDTVERCVCMGAVLMGAEEEDLLGRHQGFEYWVERHGCSVIRCHRMSLTISGFSQQISWEIDRKMTACVVVQNVWLLHWQWSSAKKRDASSGVSCLAPKTL